MRILHVEDEADDAELVRLQFVNAAVAVEITRVDTFQGMAAALAATDFDAVLADNAMPAFSGRAALSLLREVDAEMPFILVSGAIGEEAAVEMIRAGATDYVMKDKLARLVPAVERAVGESETRRARRIAEARLREIENRLRATFEQAAIGMAHVSVDGTILEANHAVASMLGVPAADLAGTSCRTWCLDGEAEGMLRFLGEVARAAGASNTIDKIAIRADGSEVPLRITASAISRDGAAVLYVALIIEDITSRLEAVYQIRRQMSLLHATIEATGDAILAGDFEGHVTALNRRFHSMLPTNGEAVGSSLDAVFAHARTLAKDAAPFTTITEDLVAQPEREDGGTIDLSDGRILEWFSAPQMLDGLPVGRVWSFRDVTERARMARTIEESERHFRSIVENIPDVLWTANEEGRLLWISPNAIDILGYTPAEICAMRSAYEITHPDDRQRIERGLRALHTAGKPLDVVYRALRKDGAWIWLRMRVSHVYERDGQRLMDGVSIDVTEAVSAEQRIAQLVRDRDLLLASTAEGIIGIDTQGHCTFANRAAAEILGRTPGAMIGAWADDLFHRHSEGTGGPAEWCPVCGVLETGTRCRVASDTFWRADGTPVLVDYVAAPVIDEETLRGVVLVFSDMTEVRATERKLEQANRIAGLGRVASTIAHEFNNVLMGIMPFAEIFRRGSAHDPKLVNAADQIIRSVSRGKRVVEEILRFTRATKATLAATDVREAIARLEPELRALLPPASTFTVHLPDHPVVVQADWYQVEQVLANFVTNARDAISPTGSVALRLFTADGEVHIDCSDDGCGIPESDLSKIFEPMFTTKRNGTGLGLAVASQVIGAHGGTIAVESQAGSGTTFRIVLPGEVTGGGAPAVPLRPFS